MQKCTVSFTTENGREVHQGDMVANDDPVIAGREDRFEPFTEDDVAELAADQNNKLSMPHVIDDPVARDHGVGSTKQEHTVAEKDTEVQTSEGERVVTKSALVEEATTAPGEKRASNRK